MSREEAIDSAIIAVMEELDDCPDIALPTEAEASFMTDLRLAIRTLLDRHERTR